MKRGDIVTVAVPGDNGKPRPAVVIETDQLPPTDSVLVCLMTSTLRNEALFRRHTVEASPTTGLRAASQIMVDKVFAVQRKKCGPPIGLLSQAEMQSLSRKLALVIGIAD